LSSCEVISLAQRLDGNRSSAYTHGTLLTISISYTTVGPASSLFWAS
jgi:hypothetical protein